MILWPESTQPDSCTSDKCLPSCPLSVATQTHIPFTYRVSTDHFLIRAKSFQNYSGPSKAGIRENTVEVTAVPSTPMKPPRTASLQSVNREGQRGHKGGRVIRASRWILPPNAIPLCTLITSSPKKGLRIVLMVLEETGTFVTSGRSHGMMI